MKAAELLRALEAEGVALTVQGEKLKFKAEREPLSAERKAQIQAHKVDLVALLSGAPSIPPSEADALRGELDALNARWLKALEAERQGWKSETQEQKAYEALVGMLAREVEVRILLGQAAADIPELASLAIDTEPVAPPPEAEPNPLLEHLAAAGGWVAVAAEHGEAEATRLHRLVMAWDKARTATERKRLAREYKAAWKGAKPALAA